MPAVSTILTAASLAVAVASAGYGAVQQSKASGEQRKARALETQRMEAQERRRRRSEIRQKRRAAAAVNNMAVQSGAGSSSGPAGGLTSLSSQLDSNQGFASHVAGLNRGITMHTDRAQGHINKANLATIIGGGIQQGLSAFSGFSFGGGGGGGQSFSPGTNVLGYSGGVY